MGVQRGFTLVEVLVALVIMAMIALLASQSFHTASSAAAATREAMDRMAKIDRTFFLMETDLRQALPKLIKPDFAEPLPPIYVSFSGGSDYWMTILRGGMANPLFQPRTEVVRVGYRYVSDELWRDTWYNPSHTDQEDAQARKLLDGIEDVRVRILSPRATSLAAGPWLQDWPPDAGSGEMPLAVEITLELDDMGEITRLFSLLPGQGGEVEEPANNNNSGNNSDNSPENGNRSPGHRNPGNRSPAPNAN